MVNRKKSKKVSIIIVHYKVKKEFFDCLVSINKSNPSVSYEVIVVDNDEKPYIEKELQEKFPWVYYIKSPNNLGYSAGNNLGVKYTCGKYLFFLNPDTEVYAGTIDTLVNFLKKDRSVAIAAPLFLDQNNKPYPLQGSKRLTPLRAIFTLSFLHKLFPKNPISGEYLLSNWNKTNIKEVDVVPGTAFMVKKSVFDQVGWFDENFFLYFEEFDLCNRVKKLGYNIFILPEAKVKHLWGVSTKRANFDIKKVFQKSRFYYFKKYYGLISAVFVEVFVRLNKIHIFLGVILVLATFLRLYRLQELMPFIGDQGWFYLSARDMILTGKIPLVGITASHTWLHQGALWTYILSIVLWLFHFNPTSGAYLTAFFGIITVVVIYITGSSMFSKNVGLIAAGLYAASPLVVMHSRSAYHTSPIPLFTVLFVLFLYKWLKGEGLYFPLVIFTLAILYNLELATVSLWFALIGIFIFGFWKKRMWLTNTYKKNVLFLALIGFIVPMLPILIYDLNHGFPQTVGFAIWIVYKVTKFLIDLGNLSFLTNNSDSMLSFFYNNIQRLLFLPDVRIAALLFFSSLFSFFYSVYQMYTNKKYNIGYIAVGYVLTITGVGVLINQAPSEAYLPVFFPLIIIIQAILILNLISKKHLFYIGTLLLVVIISINSYSIVQNEYNYTKKRNITFFDRINAARKIIEAADEQEYNLIGNGWLKEFESYTMNYQYLTWWMMNAPVKDNRPIKIYVTEKKNAIIIEKKTTKIK